jgi:hypothetical protein
MTYRSGQIESATPRVSLGYDARGFVTTPYRLLDVAGPLELPFGYLEGDILHKECAVAPMMGAEQDMLTNPKTQNHMEDLLTALVVKLGPFDMPYDGDARKDPAKMRQFRAAIESLIVQDQTFLLLAIRRMAFRDGNEYRFLVQCPNKSCKARSQRHVVDLRDLYITPAAAPKERVFSVPMAASGRVARWRHLTSKDAATINALMREHPDSKQTVAMFVRIMDIDGKALGSYADLKKVSASDLSDIQDHMASVKGGPDMAIDIEDCSSCGLSFAREFDLTPSFFNPSLVK